MGLIGGRKPFGLGKRGLSNEKLGGGKEYQRYWGVGFDRKIQVAHW